MKRLFMVMFFATCMALIGIFVTDVHHVEIPKSEFPVLLFSNQTRNDLQKSYLAAIQSAKKSILVLIYSITDKPVIYALRQKSEEGVEVTLILHEENDYDIEKKIGSKVKILKRQGPGLMHLKIMVIDDETTYISSANLTNASLKMHGNLTTAFQSVPLSDYVTKKALSMGQYQNSRSFQSQNFRVGNNLVEVWFLPDAHNASIRIKQLIREAKKTIKVAMFTFTREDFAKELISASLRGVRVEVSLDSLASKGSSIKIFDILNKSSVLLKVNKGPGLLHYKFLYIDEKTLVNGSANWTRNAFNANDDCFVVIHDLNEDQSRRMNNLWDAIIGDSTDVARKNPVPVPVPVPVPEKINF